jgi:hypothetical protein
LPFNLGSGFGTSGFLFDVTFTLQLFLFFDCCTFGFGCCSCDCCCLSLFSLSLCFSFRPPCCPFGSGSNLGGGSLNSSTFRNFLLALHGLVCTSLLLCSTPGCSRNPLLLLLKPACPIPDRIVGKVSSGVNYGRDSGCADSPRRPSLSRQLPARQRRHRCQNTPVRFVLDVYSGGQHWFGCQLPTSTSTSPGTSNTIGTCAGSCS